MKRKVLFIFNPISGGRRLIPIIPVIKNHINRDLYDFEIVSTEHKGHAKELARSYADKGYDAVFAVGGDGTVNEVGCGLIGTDTSLGILPCGSGNGLARHLGISTDPFIAVKWLNKSKFSRMDYGLINEQPFFCTCGVGFDARISMRFAQSGRRGVITYMENTIKEILSYKHESYQLSIDGNDSKVEAFIVTAANAAQWGNNAYIAPLASLRDGKLDICVVPPFTPIDAPLLAMQLFTKQLDKNHNILNYRCSELTISRKQPGVAHFDGDPMVTGPDVNISIVPQGLGILIPDKPREI